MDHNNITCYVLTKWLQKNISFDFEQSIVFHSKGLRLITHIEQNISNIEINYIYDNPNNIGLFCSTPLTVVNISHALKNQLSNNLFYKTNITLNLAQSTILIHGELVSHAFKYKEQVTLVEEMFEVNEKIINEASVISHTMFESFKLIKTFHSISIHTDKTNNNLFLTCYDDQNNKIWLYVQEKIKYQPNEAAIRLSVPIFLNTMKRITELIDEIKIIKFLFLDNDTIAIHIPLYDKTYVKAYIAPISVHSGGLLVDKEDLPTTN
tara:strand:+ start:2737 stop:3531 length:795 start_codon:yes stop_codon:yes gene_type:complete